MEGVDRRSKSFISVLNESEFDQCESICKVVYGLNLIKLTSSSKANKRRFYLQEGSKSVLVWISPKKSIMRSFIDLSQINKIEIGGESPKFLKFKLPFEKNLAVTLYHLKGSLDLIFEDKQDLKLWVAGIQYLIKKKNENKDKDSITIKAWTKADTNNSGSLNLAEVKGLMKTLNIFVNDFELQQIFNSFDVDKSGTIDKKEFERLIDKLMQKPEIDEIFAEFSNNKGHLDSDDFRFFMQSCQKEKNDEQIYQTFCKAEQQMTLEVFNSFLLNTSFNSIVSSREEKVHLDMTQPLSHYYIASSHNTYLEGNQLTGTSSTHQYTRVLQEGCRCVEIDAWDGDNGEPVVTHGHTLVNKISLKSVTKEIYNSAFITSPYPVIISLENHCSYEQTGKIGEIFEKYLKNAIYQPAVDLLIPEELKYKFIIKAKAPGLSSKKGGEESTHKNLAAVTGLSGCHFNFNLAFNSIVSLSERKMTSMAKQHGSKKMIAFNLKAFTRVYPKATRINSSNYDPVLSWCHGAQVVAINYQSKDFGQLLNSSLFISNGKAGYVLKPALLRNPSGVDFNSDRFRRPKLKITVVIISSSNLPKAKGSKEIICPLVEIRALGIPADESVRTTRAVEKNGFNPAWKEVFDFYFRFPDFGFLMFTVLSRKNKLCQNAVFVPICADGYRVLGLLDEELQPIDNCSLFVKITKSTEFEFEGE